MIIPTRYASSTHGKTGRMQKVSTAGRMDMISCYLKCRGCISVLSEALGAN